MYKLIVLDAASISIEQNRAYYAGRRAGQGRKFVTAIKQIFERILANPLQFAIWYDNKRCAKVKGYLFLIHFEIQETNKEIAVYHIYHTSRNPLWEG